MSAMATDPQKSRFPVIREAVAAFAGKAELRDAVARLLAAGFKPTDLSVLATHDRWKWPAACPAIAARRARPCCPGSPRR